MPATKVCGRHHDLKVLTVLDAHLAWTDAVLICASCEQHLLAEMIDQTSDLRAFRVTQLDTKAVQQTLRSLNQGSCDLTRAATEVAHLATTGLVLDDVLLIDQETQIHWQTAPPDFHLPTNSWRELDCDGSLIKELLGVVP